MRVIKLASQIQIFPQADLFSSSLCTNEIPAIWKSACVTLYKGGDTFDPNNYRPISIIRSVAKVFGKMTFNPLSQCLNYNNIPSQYQFGFRSKFSTTMFSTTAALLKSTDDIFSAFDCGHLTGAIFIDLTKVFDLVNPICFWSSSFVWFNSFLHNRNQFEYISLSEGHQRVYCLTLSLFF